MKMFHVAPHKTSFSKLRLVLGLLFPAYIVLTDAVLVFQRWPMRGRVACIYF